MTWTFQQNGTGDTNVNSKVFDDTTNQYTITASAYQSITFNSNQSQITDAAASTTSSNDLYVKDDGGSGYNLETGLGLTSDTPDHEITYTHGILLNFGSLTPVSITIGSVQSGSDDAAGVYAFNPLTDTGTLIGTILGNASNTTVSLAGQTGSTFMVTELNNHSGANILLGPVVASVPEPLTAVLAGIGGLLSAGYALRRRRSRLA